jgi:hypothetical protein
LIHWHDWALGEIRKLTDQQTAAARGAAATAQLRQDMAVQVRWSRSITNLVVSKYTDVLVDKKRVVGQGHSRYAEFGWVVLKRWYEDGSPVKHMCFMHVFEVVGHTGGNGDSQAIFLYGQLHSSKAADGDVDLDAFVGLPVLHKKPDREHSTTVACISADQVATIDISVVPHSCQPQMLQVLVRSPADFFLSAGYLLPVRF